MTSNEPLRDDEVIVEVAGAIVGGRLTVPQEPRGIVVFARQRRQQQTQPRNRFVAEVLQSAGLATLLFDLLTPEEEANRANVFDVGLLADRLVEVTLWLRSARMPPDFQWAISARAQAPGRHCGLPPIPEWTFSLWCPAVAGRIWRATSSLVYRLRRC